MKMVTYIRRGFALVFLSLLPMAGIASAALAGEKPSVEVEPLRPVDTSKPNHVIGRGSPESVTLEALENAFQAGGVIVFNTGGRPVTIPITKTLQLSDGNAVLDGGGLVTLDGLEKNQIIHKEWKTELTVQGVKFVNARTPKEGAAIGTKWDGRLTVINCVFDNCKTTEDGPDIGGGAIRCTGQKHLQVSGCVFNNCAGSNGGAICSLGCQLTVLNSSFTDCKAFGFGGGLDARPKSKGMGGIGGAIYVDGIDQNADEPRLYVSGCLFRNNSASDHAGAIFGYTRPELKARNVSVYNACIFDGNKVTGEHDVYLGFAGAIYTQYSKLYVLNSTYCNNVCPKLGPALFISTDQPVRVADCEFYGNNGQGDEKGVHGGDNMDCSNVSLKQQPISPAEAYLGKPPGPRPPAPQILGKVNVVHCRKQADVLAKDKPILPVLLELDDWAKKDDPRGQEAKELAQTVRGWIEGEIARLEEEAKIHPAGTLTELDKLASRLKGLPQEGKRNSLLNPLQKDKNVRALSKILQALSAAKQRIGEKGKGGNPANLSKYKDALNNFLLTKDLSPEVRKEAQEALEGL